MAMPQTNRYIYFFVSEWWSLLPTTSTQTTSNMTARYWCFTLNNPTALLDFTDTIVTYAIYSEEIGPSGTNHFQGYLELGRGQRMSYVRTLIPDAHISKAIDPDASVAYCSKIDSTHIDGPYVYGTRRTQGERSDLLSIKRRLDSGEDLKSISASQGGFEACCKYFRFFQQYQVLQATLNAREDLEVIMFYGAPGTGKSHTALTLLPNAFWKQSDGIWWDGYMPNQDIVIDDYHGWLPFSTMKRVLDKYPVCGQTKGNQVPLTPRSIVITTNSLCDAWYKSEALQHLMDALIRRISYIYVFEAIGQEPLEFKQAVAGVSTEHHQKVKNYLLSQSQICNYPINMNF